MSYPQIYTLGSYGQSIRCEIAERNATTGVVAAVDISSATNLKIVFRAPDGQTFEKTATLINSGTDGLMGYTVEGGFFDATNPNLVGTWYYQPDFTLGSWAGASFEEGQFRVVPRMRRST